MSPIVPLTRQSFVKIQARYPFCHWCDLIQR